MDKIKITPQPTSPHTTKVMKSNRCKNTRPEQIIRKILRELGYPGYRLNWKNAPGRPDIAYPGRKIAIFVNGCFWHRCPVCNLPLPKSNVEFWYEKFKRNVERDNRKTSELESMGWTVLIIWECEIDKEIETIKSRLLDVLGENQQLESNR